MGIFEIESILKNLRVNVVKEEVEIHNKIKILLDKNNINYEYEFTLGKGNRIEFMLENGIGIEVKKGKPNRKKVINQLTRYAGFEQIKSIILVIERCMDLPTEINDKPCVVIGLNKLWF